MIISIAGITNAPLNLGDLSGYMERTTDKTGFVVEAQVGNRMDTCSFTLMDTIPPTLAIPDRAEVIVYDAPAGSNVVDPPNAISAYNSFRNGVGTEITSSTPTAWTPRLFAGYVATPKYSVVGPQRWVEITSQDYTFRLRTTIVNQAFAAGSSDQAIIQALGARYRSDFDYSQVSVVTSNFPAISFPVHSFEQFLQRIIKVSRAVYRVDYFKRMAYGVAGQLASPINFADRPSYAAWVLNDLPVAYWRLDDGGATATDATGGGNPGTLTGAVTTGIVGPVPGGKGMRFSGTGQYISTPATPIGGLGDFSGVQPFSLEAWVNPAAVSPNGVWKRIIERETYVTRNGWGLLINQNTSTVAFERWAAGVSVAATMTGSLPLNVWTHVVATYDGTRLSLYINGVLQASNPASAGAITAQSAVIAIGADSGFASDWNGGLDEVAIYNYALTQQQVLQHMAAGNSYDAGVIQDGPSGYWQLDDLATPAADASGNAHAGVITGGVTLNQKPGATLDGDPVMAFDGSTGIITIPQAAWSPGANNPFTVEAWVKPGNLNSTTQRLIGMEPVANHGIVLFIGSDNKFRILRGDAAAGIDQPANSVVLPVAGQWFHVVATYDGTTLRTYVNAQAGGAGLASSRLADVQTASLTIGKTAISGNAGVSMGKVAVFNYALSQTQVTNRYNEGLNQLSPSFGISFPVEGIQYTPDGSGLVNKVWVIGGTFLSNQQAYTIPASLINGTTYQFPLPGDPEPSGMTVTVAGVDQGTIGIAPGDGDISTPSSFRYNATIQHTPATIAFKTPPGSGQAVVVTGKFRYPLVQSVSDPVLIAATNGVIFEGVVRDKRINDFTLCQTVGKNYLTNQGQTLKGGSFLTKWRGHPTSRQLIQPGQVFSNKNDVLFAGLLKDQNGLPTTTGVMVVTKLETSLSDDANQPYETILSFADRTVSGGY